MIQNKNFISVIKKNYTKGTRVRTIQMNDPVGVPSGTKGTVTSVDDLGQIHVQWDTGSNLALVPNVDRFEKA